MEKQTKKTRIRKITLERLAENPLKYNGQTICVEENIIPESVHISKGREGNIEDDSYYFFLENRSNKLRYLKVEIQTGKNPDYSRMPARTAWLLPISQGMRITVTGDYSLFDENPPSGEERRSTLLCKLTAEYPNHKIELPWKDIADV